VTSLGAAIHVFEKSREEFTFLNGKKEGKSILYMENGNKEERTYVNGILEGEKLRKKFC
jgi:antitoxin component YwqK of YwqJK toxin-antitoxin module